MNEQAGRITGSSHFIDESARIANRTSQMLKYLKIVPYMDQLFGNYSNEKRIADLFTNNKLDVIKMFSQDNISDDEIKKLLNGERINSNWGNSKGKTDVINMISQDDFTCDTIKELHIGAQLNTDLVSLERKIELVVEYVRYCYTDLHNKQQGDRTFGYLLKANVIPTKNRKERLDAYKKYVGVIYINGIPQITPSEIKVLGNPSLIRDNQYSIQKILETIREKFIEIGLDNVAEIIAEDIKDVIIEAKKRTDKLNCKKRLEMDE